MIGFVGILLLCAASMIIGRLVLPCFRWASEGEEMLMSGDAFGPRYSRVEPCCASPAFGRVSLSRLFSPA
jgi:hypothetical protein